MNSPAVSPSEAERLSNQAKLWSIVAAVSLFLGMSLILGPIAWWQGARLRTQLRGLGETTGAADTTVKVGAVVTVLSALGVAVLGAVIWGISRGRTY